LLFAPFTGAGVLRKSPPDRYIINYRASYAEETAAMIDALMDDTGLRLEEIAFFTQRDGYGDAGFIGGITALKRHGLKNENVVVHGRYERNTLAVENALADILLAEPIPRAIIMVGAYAPCARFIQLARETGLEALYLNVSFVGSAPLARELGDAVRGVIVTQVVPDPHFHGPRIVRDLHMDLYSLDPTVVPSFGNLEGYIAARILIAALENIAGEITRESTIDALEGLGGFDLGLDIVLHLSVTDHQASHSVWPTIYRKGSFVPFDWTEIPNLLFEGDRQ
ncbi:MAG: ABC transporter substrate-binding protein, partial [Gammaproteobacteria bacterium]|nr:ABC transporter substrate-binding protein [Gammaproteobacteria bacterium]